MLLRRMRTRSLEGGMRGGWAGCKRRHVRRVESEDGLKGYGEILILELDGCHLCVFSVCPVQLQENYWDVANRKTRIC